MVRELYGEVKVTFHCKCTGTLYLSRSPSSTLCVFNWERKKCSSHPRELDGKKLLDYLKRKYWKDEVELFNDFDEVQCELAPDLFEKA